MWVDGGPLTSREKQLLRRLALGRSDAEIAHEIGGKKHQISAQRERLLGKLRLSSEMAIVEAAKTLAWYRSLPWPKPITPTASTTRTR